MSDTIAAIATGNQIAAIGIVRMSGDQAIAIADRLFSPFVGKPLREQPDRKLVYGKLHSSSGELLDLCLCTVSRGPESYTGEDTAEFQCHGSPMLLRTLLQELFAFGARQAGPGEFTRRAFVNGRMDLSSAEAVIDLIDAESREAVRNAAGQLSGSIHRIAAQVYDTLAGISAHFYAVLDYPDEDIEEFRIRDYCGQMESALQSLQRLLKTFERGSVMKNGIPTAIIGLPNAGKSSLMNALLGYERAIVTNIPGTTRDTIEERIRFGGVTLRLIDTAGIHETDDPVEKLGIQRSLQAASEAGLVLAVIDGSMETDEELKTVLQTAENAKQGLVVLSKSDLPQTDLPISTSLPVVRLSAVTGEGMDLLEETVSGLYPEIQAPAGEILTNARQANAVGRAAESLEAALTALENGMTPDIVLTESERAMQALGELTGSSVTEDITNRIFSRFCVGK
ncbi:MAG: tRNA uridine-5-carboxymethylaminomethyl(34) synthesis GTPase MnmE [Oscillospiraceae bacterium]|nr:tRNA uridine-5-carboxymethylaminomethyl(34) synthesis GTPase MnmE [Oscillospiraceae bacterium]MBR0390728.1 tRNA uridine-5-carboxymethylaminomethyl(34) synthesis GTPase MnmE [Oscillospiraceae bacterium]